MGKIATNIGRALGAGYAVAAGIAWLFVHNKTEDKSTIFRDGVIKRMGTTMSMHMRVCDGSGDEHLWVRRILLLEGELTPIECSDSPELALLREGDQVRIYGDGRVVNLLLHPELLGSDPHSEVLQAAP